MLLFSLFMPYLETFFKKITSLLFCSLTQDHKQLNLTKRKRKMCEITLVQFRILLISPFLMHRIFFSVFVFCFRCTNSWRLEARLQWPQGGRGLLDKLLPRHSRLSIWPPLGERSPTHVGADHKGHAPTPTSRYSPEGRGCSPR